MSITDYLCPFKKITYKESALILPNPTFNINTLNLEHRTILTTF